LEKRKGEGAVGPAGPKRGEGARLGRQASPRRGGAAGLPRGPYGMGRGGGWATWAKGKGRLGQKGRMGEREKEKAFLFLISTFSYMPNSPLHSTANKRVHNPA
jgi:hypothetical protein